MASTYAVQEPQANDKVPSDELEKYDTGNRETLVIAEQNRQADTSEGIIVVEGPRKEEEMANTKQATNQRRSSGLKEKTRSTMTKGWNLLKTTLLDEIRKKRDQDSVAKSDEKSEQGLREIIDLFQTRVLEGVPKVRRSDSLKSSKSGVQSGPGSNSTSRKSTFKGNLTKQPGSDNAEDVDEKENENALSFAIQRKWTTDKFTTNRNRLNEMGQVMRVFIPLMDLVVIILLLGEVLLFPILVAFEPTDRWMHTYQVALELMLMLDLLKNIGTVSMHRRLGLRQKDLSGIEKGRVYWLPVDFLAALPINALLGRGTCMGVRYLCSIPISFNFFKLPSLMRRVKHVLYDQINDSMHRKIFTTSARFFRILVMILSTINLASCVWYLIGTIDADVMGYDMDWFRRQNEEVIGQNYDAVRRTDRWIQSCYYTLLILVGDGVTPLTTKQHFFCAVMMLVGTIASAVLIGETANLLSNMSAARSAFELKMEELDYMMGYLKLPRMLQFRVREYYTFLWDEHRCLDGDPTPFVHELSPAIRSEVDLFLKRGLILKSDLFVEAPFEFIRDVSSQLSIVFYLRGDYVVREGETGHSMYFISRGTLRVVIKGRFIKDMEVGDCFGEIAILRESSRRSASVYAHTHSTLYSLDRIGVHELASMHPNVLENAIARHYTKTSPSGKRSSLVFGRRASATEFAHHIQGGLASLKGKRKKKRARENNNKEHDLSLNSPQGPNFIAIDSFDEYKGKSISESAKKQGISSAPNTPSACVNTVKGGAFSAKRGVLKLPPLPGESVVEHRRRSSILKLGGTGLPEHEDSPPATQGNCVLSGPLETKKQVQRRQSQSLLGLEFRLKLVLNTLGLEKEAYQFAALGCHRATDVQFVRYIDLKGVSMVQFRRLQVMCDAGDNDEDTESDSFDSDVSG